MAFPNDISRVSVATDGSEANGNSTFGLSISTDGRYVTFNSAASNLVAGDTNGVADVFVHDRQTGETTRVNVASNGNQANASGTTPSISGDGRYVTFNSAASNLVAGDLYGHRDIFVHDRQTGETTRVSIATDGSQGTNDAGFHDISADGRYVTFSSTATNLVAGDTNGRSDIFVHDRQTGETSLVHVATDGSQANNHAHDIPNISGDGRYVTYLSEATNLVADDTNGHWDIFVHDRQTGETSLVSIVTDGSEADNYSEAPSISEDGRFVTFTSHATNLVAGDTNNRSDIFVHDRQTGVTELVSIDTGGGAANEGSLSPTMSADGRYVTFTSWASDLVAGDTNSKPDIFVHDRQTGETSRVSVAADGSEANNESSRPSISADGSVITYHSQASNLVSGDTNGATDIFTVTNPLFNSSVNLVGTSGNDRLEGGDGDDTINGGDGQDILIGNGGNDNLIGGTSVDDLRDTIYGGDGDDTIDGGYGNDELRGDAGNDTIAGGFGADRVIGGTGDDVLTGSALGDEIFGGDGFDFVNGGWGHDRVNGGADGDRFFHIGIFDHGSDWIQDYNAAEGDVLVFGNTTATAADFQVNLAHTSDSEGERSGDDNVEEAFVIYRPTGQIMWALVDGGGQAEINLSIGGEVFDLLG